MKLVALSIPEQSQEIEVSFNDFWSLYPRRVAKKDARRAWEKISSNQHTEIMIAIFEWARIWREENREDSHIPHPATWLNGERWEDEFPKWHRPYTEKSSAVQQRKTVESIAKPMPAHVIDAIKKMRGL